MEIKNNIQSTNFGMMVKPTGKALENLSAIIGDSKAKQRGLKQFIKEQEKIKNYDIEYFITNLGGAAAQVIEKKSGICKKFIQYGHETGLDTPKETKYPGKKLITKLFNPKKLLPKSLYLAGQEAKLLEKIKS